jgi:putative NADPH-quinone reductase
MHWLQPIVVHGAHEIDAAALQAHASRYRSALETFAREAADG